MSKNIEKWLLVQQTNGDNREVVCSSYLVNPPTDIDIGSEVVIVKPGGDMDTVKILCSSRHRDLLIEQISPVRMKQQISQTTPNVAGSKRHRDDIEDPYASSGSSWAPDRADSSDTESELEIAKEHINNSNCLDNQCGKKRKKVMKPSMRADAINNTFKRKKQLESFRTRSSEPSNKRFSEQRPSTSTQNNKMECDIKGNTSGDCICRTSSSRTSTSRASISRASTSRASISRASTSGASNCKEKTFKTYKASISKATTTRSTQTIATQTSNPAPNSRRPMISLKDIVLLKYNTLGVIALLEKIKIKLSRNSINCKHKENTSKVVDEALADAEVTTTETIKNEEEEECMSDYSNRSEDNVLITNKYDARQDIGVLEEKNIVYQPTPSSTRRVTRASEREDEKATETESKISEPRQKLMGLLANSERKNEHNSDEWVPIGSGMTFVHKDQYRKINFKSYTSATRGLLQAVFSRKTLATHSLTGKPSPAFQNKPAKMCLDPKKVSDIMFEVSTKCNVKENLVRTVITTKCADECKMYKMRTEKRKKQRRSTPATNQENEPPQGEADEELKEAQANQTCPI